MSSCPPIPEDDPTPNHYAHLAYTAFEYETLGLDPYVDLQAYVFPPLPPVETAPASFFLSPLVESSSYPISDRLYSGLSHFKRCVCDLYTPSYEPKSTLWTTDGEIPDVDDLLRGVTVSTLSDS